MFTEATLCHVILQRVIWECNAISQAVITCVPSDESHVKVPLGDQK